MAPAPGDRIAHQHEARRSGRRHRSSSGVRKAVPWPHSCQRESRGRAVEHAVDDEERHAPPGAPEPDGAGAGDDEQAEPDRRCRGSPGRRSAASAPSSPCAARRCGTTRPRRGRSRSPSGCSRRPGCSRASVSVRPIAPPVRLQSRADIPVPPLHLQWARLRPHCVRRPQDICWCGAKPGASNACWSTVTLPNVASATIHTLDVECEDDKPLEW